MPGKTDEEKDDGTESKLQGMSYYVYKLALACISIFTALT
jgi:hypothetical protein